jgi:hypothetical protein
MEEIRGISYADISGSSNVNASQVSLVETAWETLVKDIKGKIFIQANLSDIFDGASYDFSTDSIDFGDLTSTQLMANIQSEFDSLSSEERPYFVYQLTAVASANGSEGYEFESAEIPF